MKNSKTNEGKTSIWRAISTKVWRLLLYPVVICYGKFFQRRYFEIATKGGVINSQLKASVNTSMPFGVRQQKIHSYLSSRGYVKVDGIYYGVDDFQIRVRVEARNDQYVKNRLWCHVTVLDSSVFARIIRLGYPKSLLYSFVVAIST